MPRSHSMLSPEAAADGPSSWLSAPYGAVYESTHEDIIVRHDPTLDLVAVIALHNTQLGPAAGGCRCWHYDSQAEAVTDAARLSEGMTYKNAIAGIGFGGGKSVIMAPKSGSLTTEQLHRFGEWIEELDGRYVTAEDVGMGVASLRRVAERTRFVSGLGHNGVGGDPSPYTALGVLRGMQAAVRHRLDRDDLENIHVAVQGLGNVGMRLATLLHEQGARLTVADPDRARVDLAVKALGATPVGLDEIIGAPVDVFAPCALGGVLTQSSVRDLRATVVAGAANNQLATQDVGDLLMAQGVLYAPDYVINAGGVISIAAEYRGKFDATIVRARVDNIYDRTAAILKRAYLSGESTNRIADDLAAAILNAAPRKIPS